MLRGHTDTKGIRNILRFTLERHTAAPGNLVRMNHDISLRLMNDDLFFPFANVLPTLSPGMRAFRFAKLLYKYGISREEEGNKAKTKTSGV